MTKKLEKIYTRVYDYGRHQKTYGADLNARCICGTRDVSGFTKENDFMSSWIASLWYTCLSPLTIKKVSAIGAKTNQHLSVRTTSVPFTINLCTRYRYPRNLLSSASGDRAHFHWSTGSNSREGKTPTPKTTGRHISPSTDRVILGFRRIAISMTLPLKLGHAYTVYD